MKDEKVISSAHQRKIDYEPREHKKEDDLRDSQQSGNIIDLAAISNIKNIDLNEELGASKGSRQT